MTMPGGGTWNLAPGQITDDSELAMCLMHGLIEGKGKLDAKAIVKNYALWYEEGPFDIGSTTRNAMKYTNPNKPCAISMRGGAIAHNMKSLSNGSLMRATPMAVWCQNLAPSALMSAVTKDVQLVHSNPLMPEVVATYCAAI